ncbi:MAG: FAD-dependent oxidoreductase [Deltaproteobacteria bacterium]|nr:FAD-dependent oxidoreductase [Deltaproteobacteria bacterium]
MHLAPPIKRSVTVPVITVSKIGDPVFAEQILAEGKADFVAMGRALIADPELPIKALEGRFEDIRRCLYCGHCQTWEQRPRLRERGISCTVNPAVLREKAFAIKTTLKPKKVMVIGGGLAGMEAARILAERGHRVSLYERNDHLGGQWTIAACPEYKPDFKTLIPYLARGMKKAGVKVYLNTEVTREVVEKNGPDVVIIATGAVPRSLDVDITGGIRLKIIQANDVLTGGAEVGDRVVVVGGRHLGMEVAGILSRQGRHVSLVEALELGQGMQRGLKYAMRNRLVEQGVYIYAHSPVMRINSTGVDVANNGSMLHLKADTVVLAIGARPVNNLVSELEAQGFEIHAIGDCATVRDAMEAINEGAEIGRTI